MHMHVTDRILWNIAFYCFTCFTKRRYAQVTQPFLIQLRVFEDLITCDFKWTIYIICSFAEKKTNNMLANTSISEDQRER